MDQGWSDERLMLAYRDGDAEAFERLYQRYRSKLFRHLAHQCGDARLAEELFQDIWLKVIAARSTYEPLAGFATWLFRIAHHRLLDHYRRHARDALASYVDDDVLDALPAPPDTDPAHTAERSAIALRISNALAALPAAQRETFLMAEAGGMTLEEIARATATGRETIKSRMRYALGKLRLSLEDLL
ncbi:MAG TPA: sigma-70 family RNA polymerase sigma factor [Rhodocyclaceae bacterium]|nr:sigma-70 family RNA polymerase sigma factor [Rhodocyclaceae bacterium]